MSRSRMEIGAWKEKERERAKKRVEGWLSTISSNQAKANYKFNSELCTGDN